MNNIDWIKVLEFMMPVILLFIGGFLTVNKIKINIKLEARLKWKEEFRNKVIDFINVSSELHNKSVFLKINSKDEHNNLASNFVDISKKLDIAFYAIDLMLKDENENTHFLTVKYREIKEQAYEEFNEDSGSTNSNMIDEFYELAKEIYNDDKYLKRII